MNTKNKKNERLLRRVYNRALFPCMISILGANINIFVDGIVVGQKIGVNGLAALNLCMPVYLVYCVIGSFIVSGTAIIASKALGKNDTDKAQRMYQLAIGISLAASILVTVSGLLKLDATVHFLCADLELMDMVRIYTAITILGATAKIMLYIPFWFLRLDGRNKEAAIVMFVMGFGNVGLDYLLLYGFDLGVAGAAIASVASTFAALFVGFCYLNDAKSSFHFGIKLKMNTRELQEIMKSGSPSAMNNLMQTLRILFVNSILLSIGGNLYVAMFTAINCLGEFSLSILSGVPQSAAPMLGVYHGEGDAEGTRIFMQRQWKSGFVSCVIFGILTVAGANVVADLYSLEVSLYVPILCLAVSLIPGLLNSILIGYYNINGHVGLANLMVIYRVFLMAAVSLMYLGSAQLCPWLFMPVSEVATLMVWGIVSGFICRKHKNYSRVLFIDLEQEKSRRAVSYPVDGTTESIRNAGRKVRQFFFENELTEEECNSLQSITENFITYLVQENKDKNVMFDLHAFFVQGVSGVRIRYTGNLMDPFLPEKYGKPEDFEMMQKVIDTALNYTYQKTLGVNTVQIYI